MGFKADSVIETAQRHSLNVDVVTGLLPFHGPEQNRKEMSVHGSVDDWVSAMHRGSRLLPVCFLVDGI